MRDALQCAECGGPAYEVLRRPVPGANAIERRRRCADCGTHVSTFEVVGGTEITWVEVEDDGWVDAAPPAARAEPPPLRAKHYPFKPEARAKAMARHE